MIIILFLANCLQFIYTTSALSNVCLTEQCIEAANLIDESLSRDKRECDDFYNFVCEGYPKNTVLKDYEAKVDFNTDLVNKFNVDMKLLIDEIDIRTSDIPLGLVKKVYEDCLTRSNENRDFGLLYVLIQSKGGWPVLVGETWEDGAFNILETSYDFYRTGYNVDQFFTFDVPKHPKNSGSYIVNIDLPEFGIPWQYLVKGLENNVVKEYKSYMEDIAYYFGVDRTRAEEELKESLKFEISLAKSFSIRSTKKDKKQKLYLMTIYEIQEKMPNIPWLQYINAFLPADVVVDNETEIFVNDPGYMDNLYNLLEKTPSRTKSNYFMWRIIHESVRFLNETFRDRYETFSQSMHGNTKRKERWVECIEIVNTYLPVASGYMVYKGFDTSVIAKQHEVLYDIHNAIIRKYANAIERSRIFLDPVDIITAKQKFFQMNLNLYDSEHITNTTLIEEYYFDLDIYRKFYLESILATKQHFREMNMQNTIKVIPYIGKVYDFNAKYFEPSYSYFRNEINLPLGFLRHFYAMDQKSSFLYYGTIWTILAKEAAHAIDNVGIFYDPIGNFRFWWNKKNHNFDKFSNYITCMVDKYEAYQIRLPSITTNIKESLESNLAYNLGVVIAYESYIEYIQSNPSAANKLPLVQYNYKQLFWITFARSHCTRYRIQERINELMISTSPPPNIIVNGVLSNIESFGIDFECKVNKNMTPSIKCNPFEDNKVQITKKGKKYISK